MSASVDTPTADHEWMLERFELVDDLIGGTDAVRKKAQKYLPIEPAELPESWYARVNRSFLFAAYSDTLSRLAARPFAEPVKLASDTPEPFVEFAKSVDAEGRTLTAFAREVFADGLNHGIAGILVEFTGDGSAATLRDERESGDRVVWEAVCFDQIIGWRHEMIGGRATLTQLRIHRNFIKPDGPFGEKAFEQIKVYERDGDSVTCSLWEREASGGDSNTRKQYELAEADRDLSIGVIPFVPFYTNRVRYMVGEPPMRALAEKNVEHFQSSSDQRGVLRFARTPLWTMTGLSTGEVEDHMAFGASVAVKFRNPDARVSVVEHSGKAVAAGQADIDHLEKQLEMLGLEPLMRRKPGGVTATEKALEQAEETSMLQAWVRSLENALEEAFALTALWWGVDDGVAVDVHDKFTMLEAGDIELLLKLWQARGLRTETLYSELKKRGVFGDDFDVEDEVTLLEESVAADAAMLPDPLDDDEDDEEEDEAA